MFICECVFSVSKRQWCVNRYERVGFGELFLNDLWRIKRCFLIFNGKLFHLFRSVLMFYINHWHQISKHVLVSFRSVWLRSATELRCLLTKQKQDVDIHLSKSVRLENDLKTLPNAIDFPSKPFRCSTQVRQLHFRLDSCVTLKAVKEFLTYTSFSLSDICVELCTFN